jgi:hypothetical protein
LAVQCGIVVAMEYRIESIDRMTTRVVIELVIGNPLCGLCCGHVAVPV